METVTETPKSILNTFIETIDWTRPLEELKALVINHIHLFCRNNYHKVKMTNVVNESEDLESLQRYVFNALLKFEGSGVIGLLPR